MAGVFNWTRLDSNRDYIDHVLALELLFIGEISWSRLPIFRQLYMFTLNQKAQREPPLLKVPPN